MTSTTMDESVGAANLRGFLANRAAVAASLVVVAFDVIDCSIVALAFLAIEPTRVLYSVLGSVVMSVFLAVNHKPGRYVTAV